MSRQTAAVEQDVHLWLTSLRISRRQPGSKCAHEWKILYHRSLVMCSLALNLWPWKPVLQTAQTKRRKQLSLKCPLVSLCGQIEGIPPSSALITATWAKMSHHPRNHEDVNVSGRVETWVFLTDTRSPKPQAGKWHKPHLQLHKPKRKTRSQVDLVHINRTLRFCCLFRVCVFFLLLACFAFVFPPKTRMLLSFWCTAFPGPG